MRRLLVIHPLVRSVFVVGTVMALSTGVTFAALRAESSLTNNTIESANAALQISTNNTTYSTTRSGFSFDGLLPGGAAKPDLGHQVWLRNSGTADLQVKVAVSSLPVFKTVPVDTTVDAGKVFIEFERMDGNTIELSLQSLIDSYATGGTVLPDPLLIDDDTTEFRLRARLAADAFLGSSVQIDDIDLVFYGEGVEL
jgi:hypothetical protein